MIMDQQVDQESKTNVLAIFFETVVQKLQVGVDLFVVSYYLVYLGSQSRILPFLDRQVVLSTSTNAYIFSYSTAMSVLARTLKSSAPVRPIFSVSLSSA